MKQLTITISKTGATQVRVDCGVVGTACTELTRNIEQRLGAVTSDIPTEAMYATADVEVNQ